MRYEMKTIAIWPFIKVMFFFNAVIGFIFGLFYALFMGLIMSVTSSSPFAQEAPFDFGGASIGALVIILPIVFAIGGAIFYTLFGVIMVFIYNLIARLAGGLEFDLQPSDVGHPMQVPPQPATGYQPAGQQGYYPPPPPRQQTAPQPPPPRQETPPPPPPRQETPPPSTPEPGGPPQGPEPPRHGEDTQDSGN